MRTMSPIVALCVLGMVGLVAAPALAGNWNIVDGPDVAGNKVLEQSNGSSGTQTSIFHAQANWPDHVFKIRVKPLGSYAGFQFRVSHPAEAHIHDDHRRYAWFVAATSQGNVGYSKTWHYYWNHTPGKTLTKNQWNEVEIRCEGTTYTLKINGEVSKTFIDNGQQPLLSGGVGLYTLNGKALFDDLTITSLDGQVLASDDFQTGTPSGDWWFHDIEPIVQRKLSVEIPSNALSSHYFKLERIRHNPFVVATLGYLDANGLSSSKPTAADYIAVDTTSPVVPLFAAHKNK